MWSHLCSQNGLCETEGSGVLVGKMSRGGFIVTAQPSRVEVLPWQLCVAPTSHDKIARGRGGFAEQPSLMKKPSGAAARHIR